MKLFTTVDEVQKYLPVANAFTLTQIEPFVTIDAEEQVLKKMLGADLLAALVAQYNGTPDADWANLITKCQAFVANYAYLKYLPFALTNQSNGVINVSFSDKTKPAAEWQIDTLAEMLLERADNAMEDLLTFLEADARGDEIFSDWADSEGYTITNDCFLQTATDFNKIYTISESRSTYLAFRAYMRAVEDGKLANVLTADLYATMKGKIAANIFTAAELVIMPWIKGAIAYQTVADACPHLAVKLNNRGVQVNSLSALSVRKIKTPATDKQIADLIAACVAKAAEYFSLIDAYLKEHFADFPSYPQVETTANNSQFNITNVGGVSGF